MYSISGWSLGRKKGSYNDGDGGGGRSGGTAVQNGRMKPT